MSGDIRIVESFQNHIEIFEDLKNMANKNLMRERGDAFFIEKAKGIQDILGLKNKV